MKYKMMAVILALTVMSWAQTATQTAPSTPQQSTEPAEKAKCACCDKMAAGGAKVEHACCAHHGKHASNSKEMASCCAGKDTMSCCGGKDAKSCMKNDKNAAAGSCCKEGCSKESCGKDKTASACCGGNGGKGCEKGCCSSKKTEETAKTCCGDDLRSQDEAAYTFAHVGK